MAETTEYAAPRPNQHDAPRPSGGGVISAATVTLPVRLIGKVRGRTDG